MPHDDLPEARLRHYELKAGALVDEHDLAQRLDLLVEGINLGGSADRLESLTFPNRIAEVVHVLKDRRVEVDAARQ